MKAARSDTGDHADGDLALTVYPFLIDPHVHVGSVGIDGVVDEFCHCAHLAISLKEVAEAIGVSYETVRGWSYGRSDPTAENRAKLTAFVREHSKTLEELTHDLERDRSS